MTRLPSVGSTLAAAILFVAALSPLTARSTAAQRESRQREVFVSVTDKNGAPIRDLGPADFTVTEDNVAREVLKAAPSTTPMQIALLIDNSDAVERLIPDLRKAAARFADLVLQSSPNSEIMLMTFGERPVTEVPFTTSSIALLRGAGTLLSRSGSGSYMLQAVPDACKALTKHGATRPVIVVFSSEEGPEFADNRHARVIEALKAANATLWTMSYQSATGPTVRFQNTDEGRERMDVLNTVANDSGGDNKVVLNLAGIEPAFASVAAMLLAEYDVTYSRPAALIPPQRMTVTVKRPGVRLLAPHWPAQ